MEQLPEWTEIIFVVGKEKDAALTRGNVVMVHSGRSKYDRTFGWLSKVNRQNSRVTVALPTNPDTLEKPKMISYHFESVLPIKRTSLGDNNDVRSAVMGCNQYEKWHADNQSTEEVVALRKENSLLKFKLHKMEVEMAAMRHLLQ